MNLQVTEFLYNEVSRTPGTKSKIYYLFYCHKTHTEPPVAGGGGWVGLGGVIVIIIRYVLLYTYM